MNRSSDSSIVDEISSSAAEFSCVISDRFAALSPTSYITDNCIILFSSDSIISLMASLLFFIITLPQYI